MATQRDAGTARTLSREEAARRERSIRDLARADVLASFEGGLELLREMARSEAARHSDGEDLLARELRKATGSVLKLLARLLRQDARRREHEIDRESAWFALFETWVADDAGLLDDFEGFLSEAATLESDRRLLVRLAADELAELPIAFPQGDSGDVRRFVLRASRARLESLIASLLARDGRHAFALAVAGPGGRGSGAPQPSDAAPAPEGGRVWTGSRALRRHLETAFLRSPTEKSFHAIKRAVPPDQWPAVCARLLGHLQKHQREPTLVFKLYWNEGLLVDADGLVVTQPVDPDLLAHAAAKLKEHEPVMAAGWLLIAACRLADSFPRSRWSDVVEHLVVVRELTARCAREGEFHRVLRTFRFRHAQSPDLLDRLSEVGL